MAELSIEVGQLLSVCACECVCVESVWMLTRVELIVTVAHRDLQSCTHRPTNKP